MSRRTFIRAFRSATGTTPSAWIRSRRLDAARRLLETTDLTIEQVAADCGFGNAATLRQNFAAAFSTSPTDYRSRFDTRPATSTGH
ncbi:helix-turn-helix domain-containing protein [Arthrobacter crusticola]|uniref:helix-turn-helix domain-containing protein n=1 Tax=Arthrobacter crusticola TaxID=2547960 RepID=UPI001FE95B1D|nr:helix-turn-helix domain-containing protein [Arthrobacter crusticola]